MLAHENMVKEITIPQTSFVLLFLPYTVRVFDFHIFPPTRVLSTVEQSKQHDIDIRLGPQLLPMSPVNLSHVALSNDHGRVTLRRPKTFLIERPLLSHDQTTPPSTMPFGISNSYRRYRKSISISKHDLNIDCRGMVKNYAKSHRSMLSYGEVGYPHKKIRMDPTGKVIEENLNKSIEQPSEPSQQREPTPVPKLIEKPRSSSPTVQSAAENADRLSSEDLRARSTSTPPSSPPPHLSPPCYKSTFSLKRKRTALAESTLPLSENPNPCDSPKTQPPLPKKQRRLTQTQIDLGGETHKTCRDCGMEYIPSHAEDAALHKYFHNSNAQGVDMGKATLKDVTYLWLVNDKESVLAVDARCPQALRNRVRKVLEVVNKELGALDIADEELWGSLAKRVGEKKAPSRKMARRGGPGAKEEGKDESKEDRYKAFLYLVDERCVGLCLVERIHCAAKVLPSSGSAYEDLTEVLPPKYRATTNQNPANDAVRSSSISVTSAKDAALLGISRIWTSKKYRRKGIARTLLDTARGSFFYGIEVPKAMCAFSQPTESGGILGEAWFVVNG